MDEYYRNKTFNYTVGEFTTLDQAQVKVNELKGAGYNDAFIVAFNNDSRITISGALALLQSLKTSPSQDIAVVPSTTTPPTH